MKIMRRLATLVLVALATGARAGEVSQGSQSPAGPPADSAPAAGAGAGAGETPKSQSQVSPEITVTGKTPRNEPTLPKLAPDQFAECYGTNNLSPEPGQMDFTAMELCQAQLARDTRIVIDKCINRDGKGAPPVAIQACTELLDRQILEGHERFYLFLNRALAYVSHGDRQHALDDYNKAVQLAPKMAQPYYYRGVFYAQTDVDVALKDFDTALRIDPKFVLALRQRGILYATQKNLSGALADFTEAVRLKPKTPSLWSERGEVSILLHDYAGAVKDEAEAIRLDPKLARAYFLRGAAFGDLGDSSSAVSDIMTAVGLDPSLDHLVSTKGKTASIELPPL